MKRCPTCQRPYKDSQLKFCREDGSPLVTESLPADAPTKLINAPEQKSNSLRTRTLSSSDSINDSFSMTTTPKRIARRTRDSVAVLPLANESGDADLDYLSDGISESLINNLSQLPKLRVMARTTVFRYRGRELEAQQIGRELGVRAVLTGRVQQRQDQLVIKVELVDVEDGSQIWGGQYHRRLEDMFALETELTEEIAGTLKLKLSSKEKSRLAKRLAHHSEVQQLLLKGRYYLCKHTADGFQRAIEHFQRAIDIDPNFAPAHAELARTYSTLLYFGFLSSEQALPKVTAELEKALQLDSSLPEAHLVKAVTSFHHHWDWDAAEREFQRALELNPNYAEAHLNYAFFLADMERFDQAFEEARKAQQLDLLSVFTHMGAGFIHAMAREADEALAQGQKLLEMEPHFFGAHWLIGTAYYLKGMYQEAIASTQKALDLGGGPMLAAWLGLLYARSGKRDEAVRVLEDLMESQEQQYVSSGAIAGIFAALDEKDRAFEWLERAVEERNSTLTSLRVNSAFDSLRSDERFLDLLQRVGLSNAR